VKYRNGDGDGGGGGNRSSTDLMVTASVKMTYLSHYFHFP
jgi:hypothetical protein